MPALIDFTRRDINFIVRNYTNGTGLGSLADQFSVAVRTIRRVLVSEGVTIRGRGRPVNS